MNIRNELKQLISEALKSAEIEYTDEIILDYPADLSQGDFATPISLKLSKQLGQAPQDVAEKIVVGFGGELPDYLDSVKVAGPGFINFTLSKKYWSDLKQDILEQNTQWGNSSMLERQKYLVEHSSPNMFKPFHVGHLVNNFVGASLDKIVEKSGAQTTTLSFPSDVSPGIAKAVWGLIDMGIEEEFTVDQVGEAYAHGSTQYKEDEEVKKRINQINLDLYNHADTPEFAVYEKGLTMSYEYFVEITTRLGSTFEAFIPESECEVEGKQIVKENTPNVFVESQGAIIFEGSKHGLFDNVFINSQGFGTYLCKDIGLLSKKFVQFDFDHSITITDIEQKQHFQLVKKSAEQINTDWSDKSTYIQHGRLALTSGKISSRDGGVPLAADLLEEVKGRVLDKMSDRDITDKDDVAEQVALSALKYAILKAAAGKNIVFDFEKDLSFEGASGPYIQYAYVRACSALTKVKHIPTESIVRTTETPELERMLVRFPRTIEKALEDYSPHHIAGYLFELASEFNSFYANTKIVDDSNPDMDANIVLVQAFAQTIKNGLDLLGIQTVEQM